VTHKHPNRAMLNKFARNKGHSQRRVHGGFSPPSLTPARNRKTERRLVVKIFGNIYWFIFESVSLSALFRIPGNGQAWRANRIRISRRDRIPFFFA